MGDRGNSGVILSQIIAGIARGVGEHESCDGSLLASALAEGSATAYRAVTRPVEGTILTVARMAGDGAVAAAGQAQDGAPSCRFVLERALAAAQEAVERTPEQLPVLRQAGVVDAGGEGYRVILEGMCLALAGQSFPESPTTPAHTGEGARQGAPEVEVAFSPDAEFGYCTQFIIHGDSLNLEQLRRDLQALAASALVVGDETFVRVHGHTEDPGQLLSFAKDFGRLQRISIEDMDAQHDAWLRSQVDTAEDSAPAAERASDSGTDAASAPALALATVAVAPGSGLADVFRSLGVSEIVPGGQTMNPSAGELLDAARRTNAAAVVLLPNNGNVVSTAEHAIGIGEDGGPRVFVVPTRTVPQGIAAQLAFDPEATPDENVAAMGRAAGAVRTVEVTRATRSVTIDDLQVREGDLLGLLDDKVVAAAGTVADAAAQALDRAGAGKAEIITVYRGDAADEAAANDFVDSLRDRYPGAEVELVFGGQPHYDYLISVE
jgi:DAK2 domain fusion protein YloV